MLTDLSDVEFAFPAANIDLQILLQQRLFKVSVQETLIQDGRKKSYLHLRRRTVGEKKDLRCAEQKTAAEKNIVCGDGADL